MYIYTYLCIHKSICNTYIYTCICILYIYENICASMNTYMYTHIYILQTQTWDLSSIFFFVCNNP